MPKPRRFLALFALFAGPLAAHSAEVAYTISAPSSSLTLTGYSQFFFNVGSYVQQAPGSMTTQFSGTIMADVTAGTIQFVSGTLFHAENSGSWRPKTGGSTVGDPANDPANYGYTMDVLSPEPTVAVAIRGLEFTLTHPAPIAFSGGGFSTEGLAGLVTAGTADTDRGNPPQTLLTFTQPFATEDAGGATLTLAGNVETLTLPLKFTTVLQNILYSEAHYEGTITATRIVPVNASWILLGSGSWSDALAANWNSAVPNGSGAVATFGGAITAPALVTVSGAKTVGRIVFSNAHGYTVAGGVPDVITLADGAGTPEISVTLGTHTVSAPVVFAQNARVSATAGTTLTIAGGITGGANSLTKTGAGTVYLDGAQSYAALHATAGATTVDGALGDGTATVSVTGADTTLTFGVSQTLSSLSIGAASTVALSSAVASFGGGAVIPEPGSPGLLMTGAFGLLARRRLGNFF